MSAKMVIIIWGIRTPCDVEGQWPVSCSVRILNVKKDKGCKFSYANLAFFDFYLYFCTVIPS